jgi:hypothetical protein
VESHFQQVKYQPRDMYKNYFSNGNLLSEDIANDKLIEIEYPDGSRYKGPLVASEGFELVMGGVGEYRKKHANSNSFCSKYYGPFSEGVPHGPLGSMQLKLV